MTNYLVETFCLNTKTSRMIKESDEVEFKSEMTVSDIYAQVMMDYITRYPYPKYMKHVVSVRQVKPIS